MDEAQAIARLKRGDIGGLEVLVRLYQVRALEVAFLVTRDYALAEDVVQSAFVRAYDRIGRFDSQRPFGPWFLRSVVNSALTAVTGPARHHTISQGARSDPAGSAAEDETLGAPLAEVPSPDPGPDEVMEEAETREEVIAAIEKLSPGQRAVVVLRYYLDFSDAEVATELDLPAGTVRRRLHDARQRLRRLLPGATAGAADE